MMYRKKPVNVRAVQWTGGNLRELEFFTAGQFRRSTRVIQDDGITAEVHDVLHSTWVGLRDGDFVIRGVKGEFYPCEESVFAETYEEVAA